MNELYFNDLLVDSDLRALIKARMSQKDIFEILNGKITFVPLDTEGRSYSSLDAIVMSIVAPTPYAPTRDSAEIQNHTLFTVEIEIYTTGKNKIRNNKAICNTIIQLLQKPQKLTNYYNSGLVLDEYAQDVYSMVENTNRSILRFVGLCDNRNLTIYSLNR